MMKIFYFTLLLTFLSTFGFSQEVEELKEDATIENNDSTIANKRKSIFKKGHDPAKAALFSAILPGAGQVYNKKYWKAPIVLVGLGGLGYWVGYNAVELENYTNAYRLHVDGDSTTTGSYRGLKTESQIYIKRRETKQMLDISAIAIGVWYILNIIDATVDAHLFNFNVNDDISISLRPDVRLKNTNSLNFEKNIYSGLSVQIHLK